MRPTAFIIPACLQSASPPADSGLLGAAEHVGDGNRDNRDEHTCHVISDCAEDAHAAAFFIASGSASTDSVSAGAASGIVSAGAASAAGALTASVRLPAHPARSSVSVMIERIFFIPLLFRLFLFISDCCNPLRLQLPAIRYPSLLPRPQRPDAKTTNRAPRRASALRLPEC